ncbi:NuA3 HAT complex component NTO1 [Triticum urartu]|uniref:NuA3 HAT complex component NTO1 n=1 Tax=Triticum urartu TaxID=4572 RepID=M7Y6S2_TRIUA|nr:NuA3 HAT complex component NTO1 [Triticum urartu]
MEHGALPHKVRNLNAQATRSMEIDTDHPSVGENLMRNSGDIAMVLKKLIERGNASVSDIASEVGISSASLEAALVGETTTFSHGLKLKIIKWLQKSAHILAVQAITLKGSSDVVQDNKLDGSDSTDSGNVKSSLVLEDKGATFEMSDSAVPKPSSPRSKDNDKILEEEKAIRSTGTTFENGKKNVVKGSADREYFLAEDLAKEYTGNLSLTGGKDTAKEVDEKLISNSSSGNKVFDTSMEIPNQLQGTSLRRKSNDLTEAELGSEVEECVSSLDKTSSWGDNAKHGSDSVENGVVEPYFASCSFDDSHSYIHPFIKTKIAHLWNHDLKQNKQTQYHPDQLSKAKALGILDHSPDDEVEAEMLFLQASLLDNAMVLKHRCEDLIVKVVQNLSCELDVFSKRKWDFIRVNQFLRDVREAKKRGRKEKRHKEAQAVLAEAAAAVAASSRNSTVRKDANDDVLRRESSPKFGAGSSRVAQRTPSLPRPKDSSKPSNSKVSQVTNSGIFHMPIYSKENALYCDVCLRGETVLNRVSVCSGCKVLWILLSFEAAVHIDCYKYLEICIGRWKCELCEDISPEDASSSDQSDSNGTKLSLVRCALCHGTSGAFRKTIDGQWTHAFCAEWLLETKYMRGQDDPVSGMETLVKEKDTCCVCNIKVGACLKCNSEDCHTTFHPSCARDAGFYMNTKGFGTVAQHKAYCGKHSSEQKETDAWKYWPEEVNSLKRTRVELEKFRLLCERVIKREKVKRNLNPRLLGSGTILRFMHQPVEPKVQYYGEGWTLPHKWLPSPSGPARPQKCTKEGGSGTMQRSDDVTVDSSISGINTVRFSLNNRDAEGNTADSSRTLISFKRKFSERGPLAANAQHMILQQAETFQKELVMTSDQASTQNQRLPKGYAYVPRDSLSKEKPWKRNTQTHEPQEPGG